MSKLKNALEMNRNDSQKLVYVYQIQKWKKSYATKKIKSKVMKCLGEFAIKLCYYKASSFKYVVENPLRSYRFCIICQNEVINL